mgnify:CR=1 FL=1
MSCNFVSMATNNIFKRFDQAHRRLLDAARDYGAECERSARALEELMKRREANVNQKPRKAGSGREAAGGGQ